MARQPALYIPHGGGPCFFMDDPQGIWRGMEAFLRRLPALLPEKPAAILVVSAHWETPGFAFSSSAAPGLLYDYYGFPAHTYALRYPAPGAPALAGKARARLAAAGLPAGLDAERGLDHGVFVPLKVAFPEAHIPVVAMSLAQGLDPATHLAAGRALSPLRDEGVLLLGSGMSFHNMHNYGNPEAAIAARRFDHWLTEAATAPEERRAAALRDWEKAPGGRFAHPREEHLLPLMVAAGSGGKGRQIYHEEVLQTAISAFAFDGPETAVPEGDRAP